MNRTIIDLKETLKRSPCLFSAIKHSYLALRRVLETRIVDTALEEWIWKTRHIYKGRSWAQGYLNDVRHSHRVQVISAVASFYPFKSVLEIGCNSGPNMVLLNNKYPETAIYGIDINRHAISVGEQNVRELCLHNIKFLYGMAHKLRHFKDKSVDVVFTDAVLMFVGPSRIRQVISEIQRVARKGIVFHEYHSWEPPKHNYEDGRRVYNYNDLLMEVFPATSKIRFEKSKLTGGAWSRYGFLVVLEV